MTFARNVWINIRSRAARELLLRRGAEQLRHTELSIAAPVRRAFESVFDDDFSSSERVRIRGIERLRRSLLLGRRGGASLVRPALSSKSASWAKLLFKLTRELRPRTSLELGTNVGISGAYQASALQLNGAGRLITMEGSSARANMARRNFQDLGLTNVEVVIGRFQDTLPDVLRRCGALDFAFIDGHHDEDATKEYFDSILQNVPGQAVLAFDDIAWSEGMKRAWGAIREHQRVRAAVDLYVLGLVLVE